MLKSVSNFIILLTITLLIVNCANRGRPSGGDKDETPPVIVKTEPENYSTNFSGNEISIYFDEYVKIINLQRQLIISPPMDPPPEITPLGSASKFITIKIFDTLQPNTTYAFNFGESIVDNNEENPYPYYRFVFSTGEYIDSLRVKGTVTDALMQEADEFISVMLYDVDSTFSDSVVYQQKPKYITNTLDSTTTFLLDNVKKGKYLLVALKDENSNYTYQQKTDKIGFVDAFIDLPADSIQTIELFKEAIDFKATRPDMISGQKIAFGYEGSHEDMKIKLLSEQPNDFDFRITKDLEKDTLYYWFKPKTDADSLLFEITNLNYVDTLNVRVRDLEIDSLEFKPIQSGVLSFIDDFEIGANVPIEQFDSTLLNFIDKDSTSVAYEFTLDSLKNIVRFNFDKKEQDSYFFTFLPGSFTDYFGNTNDTLKYNLRTRTHADYGDVRISLQNAIYPVIVQLVTRQGEVQYEYYSTQPEVIDFRHVRSGFYDLRVIYDTNSNGKYDPGVYLLKQQSERVSYYPQQIEVRSNWAEIIDFELLD